MKIVEEESPQPFPGQIMGNGDLQSQSSSGNRSASTENQTGGHGEQLPAPPRALPQILCRLVVIIEDPKERKAGVYVGLSV